MRQNETLNTCVYDTSTNVQLHIREAWLMMSKKEKSDFTLDMVMKYRFNASTLQRKLRGETCQLNGAELSVIGLELSKRGYNI